MWDKKLKMFILNGNLGHYLGIDIKLVAKLQIIELFLELNKKGKTIIMVTHDEELADICQRKIVLKDGQVV